MLWRRKGRLISKSGAFQYGCSFQPFFHHFKLVDVVIIVIVIIVNKHDHHYQQDCYNQCHYCLERDLSYLADLVVARRCFSLWQIKFNDKQKT